MSRLNPATKLLAFGFWLVARAVGAQEIGVVAGRVTDQATSRPVAGAIVRITPTGVVSRYTRTDETGGFAFYRVPIGAAILNVRILGFEQNTQTIQVDTLGVDVAVRMRRIQELDTVVVRPGKQGVFGTVAAASDFRPLPNASVRMAGIGGGPLKVDSLGRFYIAVKSLGSYMFRASAKGFDTRTMSVMIVPNEHIEVAILLDTSLTGVNKKLEYHFKDFDERMVMRRLTSALIPRSELMRNADAGLVWALIRSPSLSKRALRFGPYACVFLEGTPKAGLSPNDIYVDDVESVEVYGPKGDPTGTLSSRWPPGSPCGYTGMGIAAPGPDLIKWMVVWLKH